LGHVLFFTPDPEAAERFYTGVLGFRVSDRVPGLLSFLRCSTDHHNLAFAKSSRRGFHHASYEVGSFDEVGMGGMWMRAQGWEPAWGMGRHAIGSNVFYYIRDPWGSYAEYFHDIDCIPEDAAWEPRDWEAKYALYCWGPDVPPDFIENKEAAAERRASRSVSHPGRRHPRESGGPGTSGIAVALDSRFRGNDRKRASAGRAAFVVICWNNVALPAV